MKLPKRDGLDGRYYVIHKPDTPAVVLELADQCIRDILEGKARKNDGVYPPVIRSSVGAPFLPHQLLERWLARYTAESFDYEATVAFCDAVRRLSKWNEVRHTLWKYVEQQVQKRYFEGEEQRWGFPVCTVKPEVRKEDVPEPLL